jgi:hypothetical protein
MRNERGLRLDGGHGCVGPSALLSWVGLNLGLRPRLVCVGPSALGGAWSSALGRLGPLPSMVGLYISSLVQLASLGLLLQEGSARGGGGWSGEGGGCGRRRGGGGQLRVPAGTEAQLNDGA